MGWTQIEGHPESHLREEPLWRLTVLWDLQVGDALEFIPHHVCPVINL